MLQLRFDTPTLPFLKTNRYSDGIEVNQNNRQTALKGLGSSAGSHSTSKTYDMIMIVA